MIRFLEFVDMWPAGLDNGGQIQLPMWGATASPGDIGLIIEETTSTLRVLVGNEEFWVGSQAVYEKCERLS